MESTEIIQRLLDKGQITAEEALSLLKDIARGSSHTCDDEEDQNSNDAVDENSWEDHYIESLEEELFPDNYKLVGIFPADDLRSGAQAEEVVVKRQSDGKLFVNLLGKLEDLIESSEYAEYTHFYWGNCGPYYMCLEDE